MQKQNIFSLVCLLVFSLGSCDQNKTGESNSTTNYPSVPKGKEEISIEEKIELINAIEEVVVVNSLLYTNDDGSSVEAVAFLNKKNEMIRIEEKYVLGKDGKVGNNIFYMDKGKKIASYQRFDDGDAENLKFTEILSYYNNKEEVIVSKIRTASYEELIDQMDYSPYKKTDCSYKRVFEVLNQTEEFETCFKGFVVAPTTNYLMVGGKGDNGYKSALQLQFANPIIEMLYRSQDKYLDQKLNVQFEKVADHNGFQYQVLQNVNLTK
jgi:hypothetical protein